jgi:type I restriction enzyme S subunit
VIAANEAAVAAGADLKRAAMRTLFTRGLKCEAQNGSEIGPAPPGVTFLADLFLACI